MNSKKRVLVAMSGGVDSSAVAALLIEQGYDVVGLTITTHKFDDDCRVEDNKKSCCSYTGMSDARKVCDVLGIEHHFIDLTSLFQETVINNFIAEYLHGRTPNPCVICNNMIKWGPFLTKANEYGAELFATGHYAHLNTDTQTGRYYISRGVDDRKDQSYALWGLTQDQLSRTIFPLAEYTKEQVREIAKRNNLPVFNKSESQDICFIPNGDYHSFLRKRVPEIDKMIGEGDVMLDGQKIATHKGFPFYTIGQRRGLGIAHEHPLYVKGIDAESNVIEVSEDSGLFADGLIGEQVNMMKYESLPEFREFVVKIRYNDRGKPAMCRINADGNLEIQFIERRRAVTPGQSVVMYEGGEVVGGAVIR